MHTNNTVSHSRPKSDVCEITGPLNVTPVRNRNFSNEKHGIEDMNLKERTTLLH